MISKSPKLMEAIRRARTGEGQMTLAEAVGHLLEAVDPTPPTATVPAWIVYYWSLSNERTVAQVTYSEDVANRLVEANGTTAKKVAVLAEIWADRPTKLRSDEPVTFPTMRKPESP